MTLTFRSVLFFFYLTPLAIANDLATVDFVDLDKYVGRWYEIARYPFSQQAGCHNTLAEYSKNDDGTITVKNSCRKGSFTGPESVAMGKARVTDAQTQAKLEVKFFFLAPWSDYWVIQRGAQYEYAVVSQPSRRYLWILSRTPAMEPSVYGNILRELEVNGFNLSRLEKTPQDWGRL